MIPITFPVIARLGGSMSVALNALTPVLATGGGGVLLRSRPRDSLDAGFRNRRLSAIEPLAVRSTVFPYLRPGLTVECTVGRARALRNLCSQWIVEPDSWVIF